MIGRRSVLSLRRHLRCNAVVVSPFQNPSSTSSRSFSTEASLNGSSILGGRRIIIGDSCQIRDRVAAAAAVYGGVRGYANRLSDSANRPPKETILLDGCDFEHWLVVMEKFEADGMLRDDIIDYYIKTLAQVVGSEEEARMKIYSVSTKHYYAFGALVSEELSLKLKELSTVRWVLPDSYLDVPNKSYGGEPFINGQAVPYDPKYHELWVKNHAASLRNNEKNRNKRDGTRSTYRTRPSSRPDSASTNSQTNGYENNNWSPPPSSQNQSLQPSQVLNQTPPPKSQPAFTLSHAAQTQVPSSRYPNQAPQTSQMQIRPPPAQQPSYQPTYTADRRMPPSGYQSHPSNPSQFQNHAGPYENPPSSMRSADRFMPPTGNPNQAPEASHMPNRSPSNQTYAAPNQGGPSWNSQNQNWMPRSDNQNHGQQPPASNRNPANWNPATSGDAHQHMQPTTSQMPFQSHARSTPPNAGPPPLQQQNDFPSGNTFQTARNNGYPTQPGENNVYRGPPPHGEVPPLQQQNDFRSGNGFQNSYPPQTGQNNWYRGSPQQQQQQNDIRSGNVPQTSANHSFNNSYLSQPGQNQGYQSYGMDQVGNRDMPRPNMLPSTAEMQPQYVQNNDEMMAGRGNTVTNVQSRDHEEDVKPSDWSGSDHHMNDRKGCAASG